MSKLTPEQEQQIKEIRIRFGYRSHKRELNIKSGLIKGNKPDIAIDDIGILLEIIDTLKN